MFFLIGLIAILFNKEYILINDEMIIYLTFLSITVFAVQTFAALTQTLTVIRINEQDALNITSLALKQEFLHVENNAELNANAPFFIELSLKEPLDFSEPFLNTSGKDQ